MGSNGNIKKFSPRGKTHKTRSQRLDVDKSATLHPPDPPPYSWWWELVACRSLQVSVEPLDHNKSRLIREDDIPLVLHGSVPLIFVEPQSDSSLPLIDKGLVATYAGLQPDL